MFARCARRFHQAVILAILMSFVFSATPAAAATPSTETLMTRRAGMPIPPQSLDLDVSLTPDTFSPNVGDTVLFTVKVTNYGPDLATGTVLSVGVPAGLSLVSASVSRGTYNHATGHWRLGIIDDNESFSLLLWLRLVTPSPVTMMTAIAATDQFDNDSSNNAASATIVPQQADLALSLTPSTASPFVGEVVSATLQFSNLGPDAATNLAIAVALPAGTTFVSAAPSHGAYDPTSGIWSLGSLALGTEAQLTLQLRVTARTSMQIVAAIVAGDQYDPNSNNNAASVAMQPIFAEIHLQLATNVASALPGDLVEWTATVDNAGTAAASEVVVQQQWITGTATFVTANLTKGTFDPATGRWTIGSLEPNESAVLRFTMRATAYGQLAARVYYASPTDGASATVEVRDVTAPNPPTASLVPAPNAAGWNNTAVMVQYSPNGDLGSGGSGLPALNPCTAAQTFTSETAGTSASGTCVDIAGNRSAPVTSTVKIDMTAPNISGEVVDADGNPRQPTTFGWYNGTARVQFSYLDPDLQSGGSGSGVIVGADDQLVTSAGAGQQVVGIATDRAGNIGTTTVTLNLDPTPPLSTIAITCDENNGWCKAQTATVTVSATDQLGLSGVYGLSYRVNDGPLQTVSQASSTFNVPLSGVGTATVSFFASDKAGNVEAEHSATIKYDQIAPVVSATLSPAPNAQGWNKITTRVSFTAVDQSDGSGVNPASITAPVTVSTPTDGQTVTGNAKDMAGNLGTSSVVVKLDTTAPVAPGVVVSPAPNAAGWNNTAVAVSFDARGDAGAIQSGVANCTGDLTQLKQTSGTSFRGACVDIAGNRSAWSTTIVRIDNRAPVVKLNGVVASKVYARNALPTPSCTATDALSGVAQNALLRVTRGNAQGIGLFVATCSGAKDKAGNVGAPVSVRYYVAFGFGGYTDLAPRPVLNRMPAGKAVAVRFKLGGNYGTAVLASTPGSGVMQRDPNAVVQTVPSTLLKSATTSTLTYDATSDTYTYLWATPTTYAGQRRTLALRFVDGRSYAVDFEFTK